MVRPSTPQARAPALARHSWTIIRQFRLDTPTNVHRTVTRPVVVADRSHNYFGFEFTSPADQCPLPSLNGIHPVPGR
jgi:hypothetical protein